MFLNTEALLDKYVYSFLTALDSPRALTVAILYRYGEHKQLVSLEWNPLDYNDLVSARDSLAATSFLSKATFLNTGIPVKEVALEKFKAAEAQCKISNDRIRTSGFTNTHTLDAIYIAREKIRSILGDFDAEEFVETCGWGPGATTSIPRRRATAPTKFDREDQITVEAYDFVKPWFSAAYPSWDTVVLKPGAGSKIVTVPKNAKTDRTIAIEPGINLWFQKGIGSMIRRRLRRSGIDLNDQSHNQRLARLASKYGDLATVDFSSASDTISRAVVEELLPQRWLLLLDIFRSKYGRLGSEIVYFEKFSSMGNGFTFELESLIFYALAYAVNCIVKPENRKISVYGDDVILASKSYELYAAVCTDLGFTVNKTKSYSSSCFRESCGSYFWQGYNIKPIFQKEPLNETTAIIKAANAVRRMAHSRCILGCDKSLRKPWQVLTKPLDGVPRISEGYGDMGIIENLEPARARDKDNTHIRRLGGMHEGFSVRVYAVSAVQREFDSKGLLLSKLKGMGDHVSDRDLQGNKVSLPLRTRLSRIRIVVPRWYDLGPWC